MEVRQRRRRQVARDSRAKSSSVSPGKPDDHVRSDRRVRQALDDANRPAADRRRACTDAASRPACDRSRAAAAGGSAARTGRRCAATSSTISGVQSIGSSELTRNVTSARIDASARSSVSERRAGARSRPYDPRCTPVSAISLKPAAATRSTSPDDVGDGQASAGSARRRDDAVAAALFAAGLHAQRECRPPGDARLDRRAARRRRRRQTRSSAVRSATRPTVTCRRCGRRERRWEAPRPRRRRVCVAPGHDDARGGIVARDAADRLPRPLIGGRGHRAGVDDDEIGVGRTARRRRRGRAGPPRSAASPPGSRGSRT